MRHFSLFILFTALLLLTSRISAQNAQADRLVGEWYTEDGKSLVKIFKATDQKYYGKIIWLKDPLDEKGKPKVDDDNPDPKLQNRPIIGLQIVKGLQYDGGNLWCCGDIYDPESGNTYNCKMTMTTNDRLDIRGYIGKSWMGLGRTTVWTRKK